jgi:ligand-binding sensor domain-containing protein
MYSSWKLSLYTYSGMGQTLRERRLRTETLILSLVMAPLVLLSSGAIAAAGQAPPQIGDQYLRRAWTTEEGLPQNYVKATVQTRDGYLWVGTGGGLARFDGVKFTTFNSVNTPGLKSSRVLSLYEDREGSLWIGTEHGGLTRHRQGNFTYFTTADGLPSDSVEQIRQDREGNLWAGTGKGLVRLQGDAVTTYTTKDGLPHNTVHALYQDGQGDLWFGTHAGWLSRFRDEKFTNYRLLPNASDWVTVIHERPDGGLWVGTNRGLFSFQDGVAVPSRLHEGLSNNLINCIVKDRAGVLWIGTDTRGLYRLSGGVATRVPAEKKFGTISANCLTEDREGNLWVGTDLDRLLRLSQRKVFTYLDGPEFNVVPVTEDLDGTLWIGATCAGVIPLEPVTLQPIPGKAIRLKDCVWSLLAGRDNSLWIGAWGFGLSRWRDGVLTTYMPENSGLSHGVVLAIYEDREGTLWVGTDDGLNRFRDGKFTAYRTGDGLVHDSVRFITQDGQGALWVGTAGGMSRFKDGRFTNYTSANGLSHNFVHAIHEDSDGTLWAGTYGGGLNRLRNGRFVHYGTRDGLFDDFISRILEDDSGNFWIGSNRGIYRVSRRELDDFAEGRVRAITSISYGVSDGMPTNQCNGGGQPAGWKTRDGRLWFPTVKGVAVVDPRAVPPNPTPPPVVIEECLLDRRPVAFPEALEISPEQENLEVHYTGLSLIKSEQIRFKYKLAGLDHDWVEAGTRRTAYYSHVPPGQYAFTVIAANSDGLWNTEGKSLRVVVLPPFYRTWWFLTLAGLGVAGAVFLAHTHRVRQLKREQAAQQAFSRQLIASQEAERKHLARDPRRTRPGADRAPGRPLLSGRKIAAERRQTCRANRRHVIPH